MDRPTHYVKEKKPASIKLLLWMFYIFLLWNIVRVWVSIINLRLMVDYATPPGMVFITGSGFFWVLCGLGVIILIRCRYPRSGLVMFGFAIAYTIWWWVDRLFLQTKVESNWVFHLGLTCILLIIYFVLIYNRNTTEYFKINEPTPRDI